jgi:hypothetical protein
MPQRSINLEKEMATVRATVEAMRSSYVTMEDLV